MGDQPPVLERSRDACWVDNGTTFWPPEGWHGLDILDWPRTAEAWVKFDDEAERRRIKARQEAVVCDTRLPEEYHGKVYATGPVCGEVLSSVRAARAHQQAAHRYWDRATGWNVQPLKLTPKSPRWTWEMLGFADFWDGRPRGYFCVLLGDDPREAEWEADALALGERVADHLRLATEQSGE
jgi:hypothetical protein